jgi:hypothetical protein
VVTDFPETLEIGVVQERAASPLMCTVQAPHSAMPHPNFVPVKPSVSRKTQSKGMSGSTSTLRSVPFTFNVNIITSESGFVTGTSASTKVYCEKAQLGACFGSARKRQIVV